MPLGTPIPGAEDLIDELAKKTVDALDAYYHAHPEDEPPERPRDYQERIWECRETLRKKMFTDRQRPDPLQGPAPSATDTDL